MATKEGEVETTTIKEDKMKIEIIGKVFKSSFSLRPNFFLGYMFNIDSLGICQISDTDALHSLFKKFGGKKVKITIEEQE